MSHPDPASAALWGRLDEVGLVEVCQILTQRNGLIRVECMGMEGSIYLRDGMINRVSWDSLEGRDAFLEMTLLLDGNFRFHPGLITEQTNVQMHVDRMILESALYLDYWSALWQQGVGPQTVISRKGYAAGQELRIFDQEAKLEIWNTLHGPTQAGALVMQVAAATGLDRIELVKALSTLWENGILQTENLLPQPEAIEAIEAIERQQRGMARFWDGMKSTVQVDHGEIVPTQPQHPQVRPG